MGVERQRSRVIRKACTVNGVGSEAKARARMLEHAKFGEETRSASCAEGGMKRERKQRPLAWKAAGPV
eukprot:1419828-Pleurochrysis_carterae.AAC.2